MSHCGEIDENGIKPRTQFIDLSDFIKPNQFAPYTCEACVIKIADKISYIGRDIEDAITLGILALTLSPPNPISALIAFILAGSMLAFLTFNFNPAKIFMGDSGALFSGFLLATISITGVMQVATLSILLPFIVLAVPIIDITFASLRRIFKGQSPFVADAEHIHHKLLHAGFSQKNTVVILTSAAILAGGLACLFASHNAIKYDFFLTLLIVGVMLLLNLVRVLTKK